MDHRIMFNIQPGHHTGYSIPDQKRLHFAVLHSFIGSSPDELTLEKHDIVSVIQNNSSGWSWVHEPSVGKGWFPTNYLQPLVFPKKNESSCEEDLSSGEESDYLHIIEEENQYVYAAPLEVSAGKRRDLYKGYKAKACCFSDGWKESSEKDSTCKESENIFVFDDTDSGWRRGSSHVEDPPKWAEVNSSKADENKSSSNESCVLCPVSDSDYMPVEYCVFDRSQDLPETSLYQVTDLVKTRDLPRSETEKEIHRNPQTLLKQPVEKQESHKGNTKSVISQRPAPPLPKKDEKWKKTKKVCKENFVVHWQTESGINISKLNEVSKRENVNLTSPKQSPSTPVPTPLPRNPRRRLQFSEQFSRPPPPITKRNEHYLPARPQTLRKSHGAEKPERSAPRRPPPPTLDELNEYRRKRIVDGFLVDSERRCMPPKSNSKNETIMDSYKDRSEQSHCANVQGDSDAAGNAEVDVNVNVDCCGDIDVDGDTVSHVDDEAVHSLKPEVPDLFTRVEHSQLETKPGKNVQSDAINVIPKPKPRKRSCEQLNLKPTPGIVTKENFSRPREVMQEFGKIQRQVHSEEAYSIKSTKAKTLGNFSVNRETNVDSSVNKRHPYNTTACSQETRTMLYSLSCELPKKKPHPQIKPRSKSLADVYSSARQGNERKQFENMFGSLPRSGLQTIPYDRNLSSKCRDELTSDVVKNYDSNCNENWQHNHNKTVLKQKSFPQTLPEKSNTSDVLPNSQSPPRPKPKARTKC